MGNGNLGYSYYPTQQGVQQGYSQPYGQQGYQGQQTGNYYSGNQQTMQAAPQQQLVPPRIIDCVQGELAATIYPVAYGQEVILFDMDDPERIYKKSRDVNGKVSPLEKCRIVHDEDKKPSEVNLKDYVRVDDILDIVSDAVQNEVEKRLSEISFTAATENKFSKKGDKA